MTDASSPIRVGRIADASAGGLSRVEAEVDGQVLFFESADAVLRPSPEAFATALLPVALQRGRRLVLEDAVDAAWRQGVPHILAVWQGWWGLPAELAAVFEAPPAPPASAPPAPATGLCFTCGADSFYSLLRGGRKVDDLVFVHGYDVFLPDAVRAADVEASLRAVARAAGAGAIVVRTNLRDLAICERGDWMRVHGGALAAIGHLLSGRLGTLLISSSYPYVYDQPWGSHWRTDAHWSSSRLAVAHVGAELWRSQKLPAIAAEPLVRQHLRVCWENRRPVGNCGECEKCVRTRLILAGAGQLERFAVFPDSPPLPAAIDRLDHLNADLAPVYCGFLALPLDAEVKAAIRRFLARVGLKPPSLAARLRAAAARRFCRSGLRA